LTRVMPIYAVYFMVFMLSSIGLPPLNGFVGEFMILVGVYQVNSVYGILATTGVVLGAIYMLWMYQRVFFGEIKHKENEALKDLSFREIAVFAPLILMVFVMGIYSKPFISKMEPSVNLFIEQVNSHRTTAKTGLPRGIGVSLPSSQSKDGTVEATYAEPGQTESAADDVGGSASTAGGVE
ncbi:MAG: Fe-S-binding domain-containing protein, partial [Candidatus Krumholzibacteria bacterium]|nr:Fe-S-binding domain-containing protein [Candidatus Krumholzibacteria bacterium]